MSNYQRDSNSLGTFTGTTGNLTGYVRVTHRPGHKIRVWGIANNTSGTATVELVRLANDGTVKQAIRGTLTVHTSPTRRTARANNGGNYLTNHAVFDTGLTRYTADEGTSSTSDGGCWLIGTVAFSTITSIDLYQEVVPVEST